MKEEDCPESLGLQELGGAVEPREKGSALFLYPRDLGPSWSWPCTCCAQEQVTVLGLGLVSLQDEMGLMALIPSDVTELSAEDTLCSV